MIVTFVSECEKNAIDNTCRVLDAFANRIGNRTWQTVITNEGLQAVKKMLRSTASKNTAVACHWIRSRGRSDLVWIVGNKKKFNSEGIVPVNFTAQEIKQYQDKSQWQTLNVIKYAVAVAALFHDFGKANLLFQSKLNLSKDTLCYEPYRHEWISLRQLQALVQNKSDEEWINALCTIESDQDISCFKDGIDGTVANSHPILKLSPFAQLIAWLILSHHKLPFYPCNGNSQPNFDDRSDWLAYNFDAAWNSHNCNDPDQKDRIKQNWEFTEYGLPYKSNLWRSTMCALASEIKSRLNLKQYETTDWINGQIFTAHIARLCLMLADHYYSAQGKVSTEWRSTGYKVWANTCGNEVHQQLDEHCIGVACNGEKIAEALVNLNSSLPSLGDKEILSKKVGKKYKEKFGWQDEVTKYSESIAAETVDHGFFGINTASTGMGKTLANAKIMYALGSGTGTRRFIAALGLRTLTLQTGTDYRDKCKLTNEELAIVVGGNAATDLFNNEQNKNNKKQPSYEAESEYSEIILDPDLTVDYKGNSIEHSLYEWTKHEKNLDKILTPPVLVCTIDHLMPAVEGIKGGKQIAPTLRLLTSDLVIDEPDDFGLEDLPALCRLVNFAGIMGSRVLLSTATMPPALAYALFQAYKAGWGEYAKANIPDWNGEICCAWFDEFNSTGGGF